MDDSDPDLLPEGLEDRLPAEAAAEARLVRAASDVMHGHGYDLVVPPLIEFERGLAHRMAGLRTRRMVRFVDPVSLRTLALRSDITPQIGRIAETRLAGAARPLRLCYAGQVATIRGQSLDPARERLQLGAELIGSGSVAAAGEVVSLALDVLDAAGARGLAVDFTMPDLVDTLAAGPMSLSAAQAEAVRRALDAKDAGRLVTVGGEAYLPLLYATGGFEQAVGRLAAIDAGGALASRIRGLREIAGQVGGRARLTLDPTERHGFEYQSWFGFTLYADGLRDAIGRGGTYRIARSGGAAGEGEVATGFSLYPGELIALLGKSAAAGDRLFLPLGHDSQVAARLRAIGWRTVAALAPEDDAGALGCTHRLEESETVRLA